MKLNWLASSQAGTASLLDKKNDLNCICRPARATNAAPTDDALRECAHQWASSMALAKYMMDNKKNTRAWTNLAKMNRIMMGMGAK